MFPLLTSQTSDYVRDFPRWLRCCHTARSFGHLIPTLELLHFHTDLAIYRPLTFPVFRDRVMHTTGSLFPQTSNNILRALNLKDIPDTPIYSFHLGDVYASTHKCPVGYSPARGLFYPPRPCTTPFSRHYWISHPLSWHSTVQLLISWHGLLQLDPQLHQWNFDVKNIVSSPPFTKLPSCFFDTRFPFSSGTFRCLQFSVYGILVIYTFPVLRGPHTH